MKKLGLVLAVLLGTAPAFAQPGTPTPSDPPPVPTSTLSAPPPPQMDGQSAPAPPPPPPKEKKKEPGRGDFDAGGQVRLPNGPDAAGKYAAFNWIAVDGKARYFLLDQVTLNANIPLAVKKPDMLMNGADPRLIGGMSIRLDAIMTAPHMPMVPSKGENKIGLSLTGAYMREGAMLLTEKDFPLFVGNMKPGFAGALITRIALGNLVDFSLLPAWVFQAGTTNSHKAIQIPMALIIKVGSLVKVSTDLNIATGDDYSLRGKNGGRIGAGIAVDLKIGPILGHLGTGVASLLTGDPMTTKAAYPSIRDSVYFEINAKYAK